MPYPLNHIVAVTDRHAQVTNNVNLAKLRQSFQAKTRRIQPPRWKLGQKVLWSSENIRLPNVNNKMKLRWLAPFPITQVNYHHNGYTLDLSRNLYLVHINKTFHMGLQNPYGANQNQEFLHSYYCECVPVKADRYEVENAVDFMFLDPAREPLYHIR